MNPQDFELFLESANILEKALEERIKGYQIRYRGNIFLFQELINHSKVRTDDGLRFFQEVDVEAKKLNWLYDRNPKKFHIKPKMNVFYLTAIQNVLKIPYLV